MGFAGSSIPDLKCYPKSAVAFDEDDIQLILNKNFFILHHL